ncbi:MAG: hypothetical protein E6G08_21455, partial [Actinobacteria bacterium]
MADRRRAEAVRRPLKVKVVRAGLAPAAIDEARRRVLSHPLVQRQVKRGRHRLLSLEPVELEENKGARRSRTPGRHRATVFDYAQNRALLVEGSLG